METNFGKLLVGIGSLLVIAGLILWGLGRFLKLGHLPGDIRIVRGNTSFYFPIVTSIVLSLIATLLINLFFRWRGR